MVLTLLIVAGGAICWIYDPTNRPPLTIVSDMSVLKTDFGGQFLGPAVLSLS